MGIVVTKDLELLHETVLQWIISCETRTQLMNCSAFVDQKKEQLRNVPKEFFDQIEGVIRLKYITVK